MRRVIECSAVAVTLLAATAASATIWNVPADYATIQGAIDVSVNGDTILVAPGTYTENLDFSTKTIRVLSSGGAAVTILRPALSGTTLVNFGGGGPGTEFAGFTLDGGDMKHTVEIRNGSQPWIHHNVVQNHVSYVLNAAEIASYSSNPIISHNIVIHCRSLGGVAIFTGGGQILNNTFNDCSRGFWSQSLSVIAKNNIVTNSLEFGIGDWRFAVADFNCVYNNNPDYDYGAVAGTHDVNFYPEYCDASLDNYALDIISPCAGAGEGGSDIGALTVQCGADVGPRVTALTLSGESLTHVIDHTPDIIWTYIDFDNLPQTESEIEVGIDADWAAAEMWDPPTIAGSATTHTYDGAELLDGATYWLRARVNNGVEWGPWAVRTFRLNSPPNPPGLSLPSEGSILATNSPALIVISAGDIEHDPLTFEYEVYADAALTTLVANAANRPMSWVVSPPLTLENETHWWRTRANDGYENGAWSEVRSFVLDVINSPPVAGTLLTPIGGGPVPSTAPHFDWTDAADSDPAQGPISQTLYVATDGQFVFSTQWTDLPQSEFVYGGLSVAQRYWWKVRFTDKDGQWVETPIGHFFIPGPGDMNMNQTVSLVDVIMLIDVIFRGVPAPAATYLVDVNGDCILDVADVVVLIGHVFRGGPLPLSICQPESNALLVPSQYPTISNAILAATDDDTILVAAGIYRANLNFLGKRIHLLSESGAEVTTLEPSNDMQPTIRFVNGEGGGAEIAGFTLSGGAGQHAVLVTNNSAPHIHHNIIRGHVSFVYNATAIGSYQSNPIIEYNLFIHTRSLGGVGVFSGGGTIQNNTFDDNSRGYWSHGTGVVARSNVVSNSVDFGIGAAGFAVNDFNCVFNNNVEYCCGAAIGPNDINVDPEYCDPGIEDYRLSVTSQCVGSGHGGLDRGAFGIGCGVR